MNRTQSLRVGSVLALGLAAFQPLPGWAAEHGGATVGGSKEHGGATVGGSKEHGGTAQEADEAALLREAAAALRKGEARPDLAAKLEKLAQEEQAEKK